MASRKKSTKTEEIVNEIENQKVISVDETKNEEISSENQEKIAENTENNTEQAKNDTEQAKKTEKIEKISEKSSKNTKKSQKTQKTEEKKPKYPIGSIVFVSKDAEADLNGFKLFPPYKKSTYTVEAYNPISDVYSLRRLNLSLKLKEADIVAPNERAHDPVNRRQF